MYTCVYKYDKKFQLMLSEQPETTILTDVLHPTHVIKMLCRPGLSTRLLNYSYAP